MTKSQIHIGFNSGDSQQTYRQGILVSFLGHGLLAVLLLWLKGLTLDTGPMTIAAGPGEGGLGGATEVDVVGTSEWLRFYPEFDVATLGDDKTAPPSVERVASEPRDVGEQLAESIPIAESESEKVVPEVSKRTDRPVTPIKDTPHSRDKAQGSTQSTSALVGIPGSPFPGVLRGGVGIGTGAGGGPAGIPGGSEYGRRLQQALIGHYRLAPTDPGAQRFVIVRARISRDGHVASIVNRRLVPESFIQRSGSIVIDSRVEAALLELDRQPIPFPPSFLPGSREAVVEIYFQY